MSKKRFHCQSVVHAGIKSVSITDEEHHFCLTLEDAANRLTFLKDAIALGKYPIALGKYPIALGKYPIAMELVNSCAKLMTGATVPYRITQHDAEKFYHSLEKALQH